MSDKPAGASPVDAGVGRPAPKRGDVCTDLREAVNDVMQHQWSNARPAMHALQSLLDAASDAGEEIEELRHDLAENEALRERLSDLLTRTANALRGDPPPLTLWPWHDLPDRAAAAIAAIDVMQRAAAINGAAAVDAYIDVERLIRECVPGGSICDPQQVADAIRRYFEARREDDRETPNVALTGEPKASPC